MKEFDEEKIVNIIKSSTSFRQVAKKLGYVSITPKIKSLILKYNTSHFTKSKLNSTRYEDYINKKFNKLILKEILYNPNARRKFEYGIFECDCGNSKNIHITNVVTGRIKSCGCLQKSSIKSGKDHFQWKGYGKISGKLLSKIKKGALIRNLEFSEEITCEFLWNLLKQQNFKCAISGQELFITNINIKSNYNISLDRIDSSIGYIKDNVQWVTKEINLMKQSLNQEYFIKLCKLIVNYNKD